MKRTTALLVYLAALSGCASSLTPEGSRVKVTHNAADIAGCRAVGVVKINTLSPQRDARNEAGALGADTLFVTSGPLAAYRGTAYVCGPKS